MNHTYAYPRPSVTLDVVLFGVRAGKLRVLLIRRRQPPFQDCWALPGGFLDMDEELEAGARRELLEETGLKVGRLLELGVFGALGRDPRGRVISVVYVGVLSGELPVARSGDDAAEATWLSAQRPPPTAFDHREVLRRARERLRSLAERPAEFRGQLLPRAGVDQLLPLLQAISRQPLNHRRLERVLGKN